MSAQSILDAMNGIPRWVIRAPDLTVDAVCDGVWDDPFRPELWNVGALDMWRDLIKQYSAAIVDAIQHHAYNAGDSYNECYDIGDILTDQRYDHRLIPVNALDRMNMIEVLDVFGEYVDVEQHDTITPHHFMGVALEQWLMTHVIDCVERSLDYVGALDV
jgi:hypothetical protein